MAPGRSYSTPDRNQTTKPTKALFSWFACLSVALTGSAGPRDNRSAMADQKLHYSGVVDSRFPGLTEEVRKVIRESEQKYDGGSRSSESFLWEHTTHVASLAHRLALAENLDPVIPAVAALFHDAGKFAGGRYHEDAGAEEEESARIAEPLLRRFGMRSADINRVISGLRALYSEKAAKNAVARIIHDADFLSKFGALGVASFFVKSALRGRTLGSAVLGHLSKELTYAACLPSNMHTAAGRRLAAKKAADSLKFFDSLLADLRDAGIADLEVRRMRVPHPTRKKRSLEVRLVASRTCPRCGGRWQRTWTTERGVKCRKLIVDWTCRGCAGQLETSFCLPEIAG